MGNDLGPSMVENNSEKSDIKELIYPFAQERRHGLKGMLYGKMTRTYMG